LPEIVAALQRPPPPAPEQMNTQIKTQNVILRALTAAGLLRRR
jgi:hypothetical protein